MAVQFANNAYATLAAGIASSDTSITLTSGQGARFPSLSGSDYFYATLIDTSNNLEVVKVTARASDVLTVTRGQESTTARAFVAGDRIELRVTAAGLVDATNIDNILPDQTGNSGEYLTTDGTNSSWAVVDVTNASSLTTGTVGVQRFPAGSIIQVQSVVSKSLQSVTQASGWVDLTGISVTITPTDSNNKILLMANISWRLQVGHGGLRFTKNGSVITDALGTASGNRLQDTAHGHGPTGPYDLIPYTLIYLDSPASTSAQTYKVQGATLYDASYYWSMNYHSSNDGDFSWSGRPISTLTVMEVVV